MKQQTALNWLVPVIAILGLFAAGIGLFTPSTGSVITHLTVRGETVSIWGQGFYKYDSLIGAVGFMAADVITIFLAVPVLLISFYMYRRGSFKGGLLLSGALCYFLYNYLSMGFGAAYNNLFIVYTLLFAASLYGLIVILLSFDVNALAAHFGPGSPRKGVSVFLIISGIILSLIWLALSIIPALMTNKAAAEAYYYTTFTTAIIDIGIVAPALILGGILIRRGTPFGYLLATVMVIFTWILGANLTAGGIAQVVKEVITIGQAMAFTVPFVILAVIAAWCNVLLFRNFSEKVA